MSSFIVIPISLCSIPSPIYPKQPRFGSLVARALGDALPKAISLLRALDMCQVWTEGPFRSTLHRSYITDLDMWSMYRSCPFRSILNTGYITGHVSSICRSCPFRSILNTGYITGLDMCQVCTQHSVAFWTRATSQARTCVKSVRKQSIP